MNRSANQNESFVLGKLPELDLPADQFIVVGSGILDVLGIRRANDIDFVTTPKIFSSLKSSGWKVEEHPDRQSLNMDCFEAYLGWDNPDGLPNLEDLLGTRQIVDGYNFVDLERVLAWKEQKTRPKDLNDVKLIKDYLEEKA